MKKVISDFIELLSNSLLVLSLFIVGFLILTNVYHSNDISTTANINYSDYASIRDLKNNIIKVERILNSVNFNYIPVNSRTLAISIDNFIKNAVDSIKKTDFYNLSGTGELTYKNVYDYNDEVLLSLSYDCLFYLQHNVGLQVHDTRYEDSFKVISSSFADVKSDVDLESNHVKNRLLSNSNYSYVTDITRITVFNDLTSTFSLVASEYQKISNSLLVLANWYADEFGGVA